MVLVTTFKSTGSVFLVLLGGKLMKLLKISLSLEIFGVHILTQESVRLVKVAGAAAAGDHSTVTDVADAASAAPSSFPTGRVAVNANPTLLHSCTRRLPFPLIVKPLYCTYISILRVHLRQVLIQCNSNTGSVVKCAQNYLKSVRETSRL